MPDDNRFPPELIALDCWVNWDPATKKPTPGIRGDLLPYADACARDAAHVGFVFFQGNGYIGIDIDEMTPLAAKVLQAARKLGAYVEQSPSGEGWHIIGRARLLRAIGKRTVDDGIEAYATGRYFTMTGRRASGSVTVDIQRIVDSLEKRRKVQDATSHEGPGEWSPECVEALQAIPADSYGVWVEVGMALHAAGASVQVYDQWSRTCPEKYPGEAAVVAKWNSFGGEGIGLGTLFHHAQECGWNPRAESSAEDWEEVTEERGPWQPVMLATLTHAPPPRVWAWDPWIPEGVVTGLVGPPGVAKSTLALQLAIHHALGLEFLGCEMRKGPALFLSVEDDLNELHRRSHRVCGALMVEPQEVAGMGLVAATEMATALVHVDKDGALHHTQRFRDLREEVRRGGYRLVVLDLVGDFWDGSENARGEVTGYVRGTLARWAAQDGLAVVAVGHVNKAGAVSGSTAWEGSYRSALALERGERHLELRRIKANYTAPMTEPELLEWREGYLVPVSPEEVELEALEDHALWLAAVPAGEWLGIEALRACWGVNRAEGHRRAQLLGFESHRHAGALRYRKPDGEI